MEIDEKSYESIDNSETTELKVSLYLSKDNKIQWYSEPFTQSGRDSILNVMKLNSVIIK